ncbi:cAMP-responsive element modulator-like [Bombina bombina]|uniref:cAMP-responsive element modulator-like n=1 Tax=Bombina bombina TaxID=8345 RepID=UPI00235AA832|nr:cAMP-responsive element modulator-like [Bombina bombina]
MIPKTEDEHLEKGGSQASFVAMSVPASMYQTSTRQYISVTQRPIHIGHAMSDRMTGLPNSGTQQPGPRLVPCAPPIVDGTQQFFMPSQIIVPTASEDMPTYQIRIPTSALPQGIEVAAPPNTLHNAHQTEDATRKRELRLMKNREAAWECRKKKEYVKCFENRVAVLENQNKTLIEELKAFKDLYCHKAE